jgi:hypothetical protein
MADQLKVYRAQIGDDKGVTSNINKNSAARLKAEAKNAQAQAELSEVSAELSQAIMVNGFAHKAGQAIQNNTKQVVNGWLS